MSDFLADLIDRARDSGTGLQRRRPSLFEPPVFEPPVDAPGLDGRLSRPRPDRTLNEDDGVAEAWTVEAEPPSPPAVVAPRRTTLRRSPSRTARNRSPESTSAAMPDVEGSIEPAGGPRLDGGSVPSAELPAAKVTATPRAARSLQTVVEEPGTRPPQQPSARPTREASVRNGVPPVARPELAPVVPSTGRPAVRSDRSRQAAANEEAPARRDAKTTVTATAVVLRPPMPVLPRPDARRSERPAPAIGRETPPASPATIQVTIGRIEVRATPAPDSPARSSRATTPALSLEDYLRQRSGGAT